MKCSYVGCKKEARYCCVSRVINPRTQKPQNILNCCEGHAPKWVYGDHSETIWAKMGGDIPILWDVADLVTGEVRAR